MARGVGSGRPTTFASDQLVGSKDENIARRKEERRVARKGRRERSDRKTES